MSLDCVHDCVPVLGTKHVGEVCTTLADADVGEKIQYIPKEKGAIESEI